MVISLVISVFVVDFTMIRWSFHNHKVRESTNHAEAPKGAWKCIKQLNYNSPEDTEYEAGDCLISKFVIVQYTILCLNNSISPITLQFCWSLLHWTNVLLHHNHPLVPLSQISLRAFHLHNPPCNTLFSINYANPTDNQAPRFNSKSQLNGLQTMLPKLQPSLHWRWTALQGEALCPPGSRLYRQSGIN